MSNALVAAALVAAMGLGGRHDARQAPAGASCAPQDLGVARPAGGPAAEPSGHRIQVNTATPEELERLPGIGPKKAARMVEARSKRPFRSGADLRRVKGFGPKTVSRLAPLLDFGLPAP